jgi:hypothetical protein
MLIRTDASAKIAEDPIDATGLKDMSGASRQGKTLVLDGESIVGFLGQFLEIKTHFADDGMERRSLDHLVEPVHRYAVTS